MTPTNRTSFSSIFLFRVAVAAIGTAAIATTAAGVGVNVGSATVANVDDSARTILYVAPNTDKSGKKVGENNVGDGSSARPFRSLNAAFTRALEIRAHSANATISVRLRPGLYFLRETTEIPADLSGTPNGPFVLEGEIDPTNPKNRAVLVGGVEIPASQWTSAPRRAGFPKGTLVADLAPLLIERKFHQIFNDGTRQIWARWPNFEPNLPFSGGWAYVDGKRIPMYTDVPGERTDLIKLTKADRRDWARPTDGEICVFPRYNWWNVVEKIKNYDRQTGEITLEKSMQYAARPMDRFAVFGMREELDSPGEWYQDVEEKKLYYLPSTEPSSNDSLKITAPTVDAILSAKELKHAVLRNIELTCAETNGVRLQNCVSCRVEKLSVRDLGYMTGAGIAVLGGKDVVVRGCDLWNLGGHGVEISGGDSVKMEKARHVVENCYIHHIGRFNRHGIGVIVSGCGTTVSHNLIHDVPRCGIFHGGVLHVLEFNRIRHCNLEMEDSGCTYGGGWTGGWTTIRYNYCSDSVGFNNFGKFNVFTWGIYLDEAGRGFDVYGNVVEHCQAGAMHLHNACDNRIWNNIFVSNGGSDGDRWQFSTQTWNNSPDGYFVRVRREPMLKEYEKLTQNPAWKKERGMDYSPENPFLPDGTTMRGNVVEKNIFYYPNQPKSQYFHDGLMNLEANKIDRNVVFSGTDILTGRRRVHNLGFDRTALVPNANFSVPANEEDSDPNRTAADGWFWYQKTRAEMTSTLEKRADSSDVGFLIGAAFDPSKPYIKTSCVRSKTFELEAGKEYSLSFDLELRGADDGLTARVVSENGGFWKAFGSKKFSAKNDDKIACQTSFHWPQKGDSDFDERLGAVDLQFEFHSHTGAAVISNLKISEVEALSEWDSWRADGADVGSIVADPLFENPKAGDWRLKPNSPALKLGFEPLPLEKIGPFKDASRASWPIVEAEGVREHPEWLTSVMKEH